MIVFRMIWRVLGALMVMMGLAMILPWCISLYLEDGIHWCYLLPILACTLGGLGAFWGFRSVEGREISTREAFLIVTLGWVLAAFAASLPYWLYSLFYPGGARFFPNLTAAYFEAMSGLTTTGSTILPSIEDLPKSFLFWRCLTHWLGGMGIILLGIAILPLLGIGGMQLFRAEVPGPTTDKLRPRIKETAKSLWIVYILLTFFETIFLYFGGLSFFDSVCHSFSTIATGGFSTLNKSVEGFQSVYVEMVITVFMIFAGMNFALHYFSLRGDLKKIWKNAEFRFYSGVIVFWTFGIALVLYTSGYYSGIFTSLRYSVFQVVSIVTSTGFSSWNFDDWWIDAAHKGLHASLFSVSWLVLLMFIGGCAGSTGGGVKCLRIMLLIKMAYREMMRLLHPRMVNPIKVDNQGVADSVLFAISGFFILYLTLTGICTLLLTTYNIDFVSAFTAVAASIGNIGPGLAKVGPYQNYAFIPIPGQWLLIFCMLLGRLEIYTVLIILMPHFWKR